MPFTYNIHPPTHTLYLEDPLHKLTSALCTLGCLAHRIPSHIPVVLKCPSTGCNLARTLNVEVSCVGSEFMSFDKIHLVLSVGSTSRLNQPQKEDIQEK